MITSVDFPQTVSNGPGTETDATIGFSDPGGDIARLVVTEISDDNGIYTPRTFDVAPPFEGPPVVIVPLWECSAPRGCSTGSVTVDLTLVDQEGNVSAPARVSFSVAGSAPVIDSVHFSPILSTAPGSRDEFVVFFRDPDGDITRFQELVVSGNANPADFDPGVTGVAAGQFSFFRVCNSNGCAAGDITLDLVLSDFAGNLSSPFRIAYTRQAPITQPPAGVAAKAVPKFPSMDEGGLR